MFVGLASAIGIGLPRRLASSAAARSNQYSSRSSRYRMALGKSFGRTVRREGRPGTAADGLVEAAASFPAENRSGVWLLFEPRAIAKIIRRGRNVTDAAFLSHSQIKTTDALKKTPRQSTRLGVYRESLPQLRLLAGRQGVGGDGACRPVGLMRFK